MNPYVPGRRYPAPQPWWRRMLWVSLGLVYLFIWPLSGLVRHGGLAAIAVGVPALLSFVAAFLTLAACNQPQDEHPRRAAWILLGTVTAMAIAYPLLLGGDWLGLPIYLGVGYAMALPIRWARRGVLAGTALTAALCLGLHTPSSTTALLSFETLTIGMLMLGFRGSRVLVAQLHEARDEVARLAANEERLRIARDLHDLLGHTLSLIVLKSEVAVRLADRDPARSLGEVRDIETVARQALTDVREAVTGYRRRTLAEEVDGARATLAAAGVAESVAMSGTPLPAPLDGLFAWAVREGVTNIVRHANARTAAITIARRRDTAVLEITDDGHGPGAHGTGNGLAGLAERVAAAGGTADFGAAAGGGFRLTVRVPLTAAVPGVPAVAREMVAHPPAPAGTATAGPAAEPAASETGTPTPPARPPAENTGLPPAASAAAGATPDDGASEPGAPGGAAAGGEAVRGGRRGGR